MALDESDDDGLIQLREITSRLDARFLKEAANSRQMTNDRAADKSAIASQITGKVLENPFAWAQLDWPLGRDGIDLAQNSQELLQREPITRLRTSLSGTIGQVSCDCLFIDIVNTKLPPF
jgi:hypothetical protein